MDATEEDTSNLTPHRILSIVDDGDVEADLRAPAGLSNAKCNSVATEPTPLAATAPEATTLTPQTVAAMATTAHTTLSAAIETVMMTDIDWISVWVCFGL